MREKIERLLEEREWQHFLVLCSEDGPDRLRAQAWQWCDELKERGHRVSVVDVQDALLELAHELLPDSPAGSNEVQEQARSELLVAALGWYQRQDIEPPAQEDIHDAWALPLSGFRAWLREGMARQVAA